MTSPTPNLYPGSLPARPDCSLSVPTLITPDPQVVPLHPSPGKKPPERDPRRFHRLKGGKESVWTSVPEDDLGPVRLPLTRNPVVHRTSRASHTVRDTCVTPDSLSRVQEHLESDPGSPTVRLSRGVRRGISVPLSKCGPLSRCSDRDNDNDFICLCQFLSDLLSRFQCVGVLRLAPDLGPSDENRTLGGSTRCEKGACLTRTIGATPDTLPDPIIYEFLEHSTND